MARTNKSLLAVGTTICRACGEYDGRIIRIERTARNVWYVVKPIGCMTPARRINANTVNRNR